MSYLLITTRNGITNGYNRSQGTCILGNQTNLMYTKWRHIVNETFSHQIYL